MKLPTLSLSELAVAGAKPSATARFLAGLAPGQLLEVTVLEVGPRGAAIRIGEQRLLAGTRLDLVPGERLTVRVEQVDRQPTLSVLARSAPVGPTADAVASRALRASLPIQQPLDRVLRALAELGPDPPAVRAGERALAMKATAPDRRAPERPGAVLDAWRALLTDRNDLADAMRLRSRIVDAGLHLEAKLAREALPASATRSAASGRQTIMPGLTAAPAVEAAPEALASSPVRPGERPATPLGAAIATGSDTKAVLNRLRERAAQAMSLAPSAQGRRELELIDHALARIRVLQLASITAQEESRAVRLHIELPVAGPAGQIERLEVEIYEQPDDEATDPGSRRRDATWHVVLHLEPPELGALEARIAWRAGAVSARLVAARASTAQAIRRDLARLEAGLRDAGLTVETLRCEHGDPAGPAGPAATQPLVHVVV